MAATESGIDDSRAPAATSDDHVEIVRCWHQRGTAVAPRTAQTEVQHEGESCFGSVASADVQEHVLGFYTPLIPPSGMKYPLSP